MVHNEETVFAEFELTIIIDDKTAIWKPRGTS